MGINQDWIKCPFGFISVQWGENWTPAVCWRNFRINYRWAREEFLPVIAAFHPQSQLQYSSQWSLKRGAPSHYSASPGRRRPENTTQPRPQTPWVNVNTQAVWEIDHLTCSRWPSWPLFFSYVDIYVSLRFSIKMFLRFWPVNNTYTQ